MFSPLFLGKLVRLAASSAEDREIFAAWSRDADYMRMLDDDPIRPQSPENFSNFGGAVNDHYFHLRTLDDDVLIGFVVLFNLKWPAGAADMAIGIGDPAYRGKGYGSDALRLILNYAFNEVGLYRVGLTVMEYNSAAIKSYERAGFVREGAKRKVVLRDGKRYDLVYYGILRDEWLKQP